VVVVIPHWGTQYTHVPEASQRRVARAFADAGADVVVGGHPHITQGTESYNGHLIVYSLGNFVFDGFSDADNNTGSILWMTVTAAGVRDWRLQPVHIDASGRPHAEPVATAAAAASQFAANPEPHAQGDATLSAR